MQKVARAIIRVFEELLDANNLSIPDIHRKGDPDEAKIYGNTYYQLEDRIVDVLNKPEEVKINHEPTQSTLTIGRAIEPARGIDYFSNGAVPIPQGHSNRPITSQR